MLSNGAPEGALAFIPVAGPFAAIGGLQNDANGNGVANFLGTVFLGAMGIVQSAGAILLAVGYGAPHKVLIPVDESLTLRPVPLLGKGMQGVGVAGSF
jgi:hypothetical protein